MPSFAAAVRDKYDGSRSQVDGPEGVSEAESALPIEFCPEQPSSVNADSSPVVARRRGWNELIWA